MNRYAGSREGGLAQRCTAMLSRTRAEAQAAARFCAHPVRGLSAAKRAPVTAARFLSLLAMSFVFALCISLPLQMALEHWTPITSKQALGWRLAIGAILVAPIAEEVLFRAGLRSARYTLFIGPALLALVGLPWPAAALVIAMLAVVALGLWMAAQRATRLGHSGWQFARGRAYLRTYPWVFWTYALGFALVHASNFDIPRAYLGLAILATSAQLFDGLLLGYLRLQHGLKSAMAFHAAINVIGVSFAFALD